MSKKPTLKAMREYLDRHFRYYTMNSWNQSTSYACNVKLHTLNIPKEDQDTAYALLSMDDANIWGIIRYYMLQFEKAHDYAYQMGFNGRSGGYIVLYQGGKNEDGRRYTMPGKGLSHEGLSSDGLRKLYAVVKHFDAAVDLSITEFINFAHNYRVEEQEIMVPTKVMVAVEKQ